MGVKRHYLAAFITAAASAAIAQFPSTPSAAGTASCADLATVSLPGGMIASATDVTEPFTTTASGGAGTITVSVPFHFCRVAITLAPSADSDIHAEIWLPPRDRWNGKFVGVGNGGLTGVIWRTSMVRPLQSGYAVANSDLGHTAPNADWALGHPEKVIDYAYRADHVTAQAAKAIVAAYYGRGARLSYFHGCSNGGHQALIEAQRYPDDYNGIVTGAPWNNWTDQVVEFIWRAQYMDSFDRTKLPMLTNAVVAQCAARDGGVSGDGYLNDPRKCHFEPKALRCIGADGPTCLTAREAEAVDKLYEGPRNAKTGRQLFPGFERGSEFGWSASVGSFSNNLFRSMIYEDNPTWDFHLFDFDRGVDALNARLAAAINSNNPNVSAFCSRGSKIIMWHGWTDTTLEPRNSINYYSRVVATIADAAGRGRTDGSGERRAALDRTQEFFRLFMAPAVNHCGNGAGPNSSFAYTMAATPGPDDPDHDVLAALDRWVAHGTAPERLIASHFTNGTADRTRPICAYPKIAQYRGAGDPNAPGSFTCVDDWDQFNRSLAAATH